jgi:uncharacterized membrane protein
VSGSASGAVSRATSSALPANPSASLPRRWGWPAALAFAAIALALAGLGVATYLTVVHYAHQSIACNGLGDCEYVNSSKYAEVAGLPVALMGAFAYATMALLVAASWLRRDALFVFAAWAVGAASLAFSIYLTYIELEVLDAICVYCVASASIMTALFAVLSGLAWAHRGELLGEGDADDLIEA